MGVDGGVQKSATRQAAEWKEEIRGGGADLVAACAARQRIILQQAAQRGGE